MRSSRARLRLPELRELHHPRPRHVWAKLWFEPRILPLHSLWCNRRHKHCGGGRNPRNSNFRRLRGLNFMLPNKRNHCSWSQRFCHLHGRGGGQSLTTTHHQCQKRPYPPSRLWREREHAAHHLRCQELVHKPTIHPRTPHRWRRRRQRSVQRHNRFSTCVNVTPAGANQCINGDCSLSCEITILSLDTSLQSQSSQSTTMHHCNTILLPTCEFCWSSWCSTLIFRDWLEARMGRRLCLGIRRAVGMGL
jgi:hypothetical protein